MVYMIPIIKKKQPSLKFCADYINLCWFQNIQEESIVLEQQQLKHNSRMWIENLTVRYGASVAQWVKPWPTDLGDQVQFPLKAKSSQP